MNEDQTVITDQPVVNIQMPVLEPVVPKTENPATISPSSPQNVDNSDPVASDTQIQQDNNKPLTGFQLHPEHINRNGAPKSEVKKAREKIQQTIEKILDEAITTQDGKIMTKQVAMIRSMVSRAIKKDNVAASILMDRIEGKVRQPIDVSGELNLNVNDMLRKIYGDTEPDSTT